MDDIINKNGLDRRDAALASRLCLGVLQNISLCCFYIDSYSSVKCKKLEPKVLDILLLGAYQLLFMNIPARAAVNESVALCKSSAHDRASGLVNAVLRRIAENVSNLPDIPGCGTGEHLSIKYSHSQWLVERLIAENGYEHTEAFLSGNNSAPPLTLQVNSLKISPEEYEKLLIESGIDYRVHQYLPGCFVLSGGNVSAYNPNARRMKFTAGCTRYMPSEQKASFSISLCSAADRRIRPAYSLKIRKTAALYTKMWGIFSCSKGSVSPACTPRTAMAVISTAARAASAAALLLEICALCR